MPSLEDLTPEQQEQAARLFSFVKSNPDIEKNIRREAKRKNPNMSAPDIELEDALAKQREEFEAKLKERDAQALTQLQQQRRAEAHARIRNSGLDPEEIEKLMVNESIGNYDTAINYARAQKQLAPSTAESITPMSLPNSKDLWANKNKFARDSAFEAINELKAGRRLGQ
jgi:hypothetical protein